MRNEGVSGRDFSADEEGGLLVTLRSVAGTVQCACALFGCRLRLACTPRLTRVAVVYPFMTPVSDGGLQKSRMSAIRDQLRWRLVGCELQECYAQ